MTEPLMTMLYPWLYPYWQQLWGAYQTDALAHAWIFEGPHGGGKAQLPQVLAEHLLCKQKRACGQCSACQLIVAQSHPDLIRLAPEQAGKDIKVEAIRQLINQLDQTAHQGGWRIVIIEDAEWLNRNAANALLKTLEEPPENTFIALLIADRSRLPATLLSRCRNLFVPLPEPSVSKQWLSEFNFPKDTIDLALKMSDGAPLIAKESIETERLDTWKRWRTSFVRLLEQKADVVETADYWNEMGIDCLDWFAQALHKKVSADTSQKMAYHRLYSAVLQARRDFYKPLRQDVVIRALLDQLLQVKK